MGSVKLLFLLQKRQGMDIKQMKAFVSEELKGLKQEHRLLSLREFRCSSRRMWAQSSVSQPLMPLADISASESIMKTKTSQDFQELLRVEHCRNHPVFTFAFSWVLRLIWNLAVAALLEGFQIRECVSFIEEHIISQVRLVWSAPIFSNISGIIFFLKKPCFLFNRPPWLKVWGFFVFCPSLKTVSSVCFNLVFKMCEMLYYQHVVSPQGSFQKSTAH